MFKFISEHRFLFMFLAFLGFFCWMCYVLGQARQRELAEYRAKYGEPDYEKAERSGLGYHQKKLLEDAYRLGGIKEHHLKYDYEYQFQKNLYGK